jgi:hypothetical protein
MFFLSLFQYRQYFFHHKCVHIIITCLCTAFGSGLHSTRLHNVSHAPLYCIISANVAECTVWRQHRSSLRSFPCFFTPLIEAAFLDITKSLKSFPPCYSQSPLPHFPLRKSGLKLVCNVNIVYGNLKSENSQDYARKPQRTCTFMNSASGLALK